MTRIACLSPEMVELIEGPEDCFADYDNSDGYYLDELDYLASEDFQAEKDIKDFYAERE